MWSLGGGQRDCKQLVLSYNANVSPVGSIQHRWLAGATIYRHSLQTLKLYFNSIVAPNQKGFFLHLENSVGPLIILFTNFIVWEAAD